MKVTHGDGDGAGEDGMRVLWVSQPAAKRRGGKNKQMKGKS